MFSLWNYTYRSAKVFYVETQRRSRISEISFGQSFTVTPVAELQSFPEYSLCFHVSGKMGDTRSYLTPQEPSLQCSEQGKTLSFSVATTFEGCFSSLGHGSSADCVLPALCYYASILQNHCFPMLWLPICNYDLIISVPDYRAFYPSILNALVSHLKILLYFLASHFW